MRLLEQTNLLWQQLDGPQARGIVEGGRKWFNSWLLDILSYFDNFKIATAKGPHLDFIGLLMGIPRPVVISPSFFEMAFKYTNPPPGTQVSFGYGDLPQTMGGYFDYLSPYDRPGQYITSLDDNNYRRLLAVVARSTGEVGSLIFLDDVCHEFAGTNYIIGTAYGDFAEAILNDVYVKLTNFDTMAFVIIEGVARRFISPFPRVFMDMVSGA